MDNYIKQVAEAVRHTCQHAATDCAERIDASDQYGKDRLMGAYLAASSIAPIDLDPIITSVPKPDPVAYVSDICMNWLKLKAESVHAKIYFEGHSYPFCEDTVPLYTYPPYAQAEIDKLKAENNEMSRLLSTRVESARLDEKQDEVDRLKSEATKREAFIDELVKQRHVELMLVALVVNDELAMSDESELESIVAKIEQGRGQ